MTRPMVPFPMSILAGAAVVTITGLFDDVFGIRGPGQGRRPAVRGRRVLLREHRCPPHRKRARGPGGPVQGTQRLQHLWVSSGGGTGLRRGHLPHRGDGARGVQLGEPARRPRRPRFGRGRHCDGRLPGAGADHRRAVRGRRRGADAPAPGPGPDRLLPGNDRGHPRLPSVQLPAREHLHGRRGLAAAGLPVARHDPALQRHRLAGAADGHRRPDCLRGADHRHLPGDRPAEAPRHAAVRPGQPAHPPPAPQERALGPAVGAGDVRRRRRLRPAGRGDGGRPAAVALRVGGLLPAVRHDHGHRLQVRLAPAPARPAADAASGAGGAAQGGPRRGARAGRASPAVGRIGGCPRGRPEANGSLTAGQPLSRVSDRGAQRNGGGGGRPSAGATIQGIARRAVPRFA